MHRVQAFRRPGIIVSAVLFVAALLVAVATPAQAATATSLSNTDTYSRTGTRAFVENGECVNYAIKGKITYTAHKGPKDQGLHTYWLSDIKIRDPKIAVQAVKYSTTTHGCTSTKAKFKSLGVRQLFKGYSCSYNPTITVGIPFSVSVSFWPTCGTKKSAQYGFTFKDDDNGTDLHPGVGVKFSGDALRDGTKDPKTGPCYGVVVKLAIYTGSIHSEPNYSGRHKLCLTPKFK